jgi:NADH-quinone oxidoreductase subunit N
VDALIGAGGGWLAGVVAINAVVALAYYIRTAAVLYAGPVGIGVADLRPPKLPVARPVAAALIGSALVAVVLGFAPQMLFDALS